MLVRTCFKKPIYPPACGRVGRKVRGGPYRDLQGRLSHGRVICVLLFERIFKHGLRSTLMACLCVSLASALASAAEPVSFRSQIAPVLLEHCLACHGPKKAEGGYRVDTFEELQRVGDSGEQPIVAANADASELVRRLISHDESIRMPADSEPLPAEQIELIKAWVAEGAKYDGQQPSQSLLSVMPPLTYSGATGGYPRALPITALAFTPDSAQIVSGGYHELLVWNADDGTLVRRIPNMAQTIYSLAFCPIKRRWLWPVATRGFVVKSESSILLPARCYTSSLGRSMEC